MLTGTNDDDVIAGIRARTTVSLPVKALVSRGDPDTFVVSYAGPTADEAQRVTNRLLKVFIERDGNNRQSRAKETAALPRRAAARQRAADGRSRSASAPAQGIEHRPAARPGAGQPAGDERHPPAQRSQRRGACATSATASPPSSSSSKRPSARSRPTRAPSEEIKADDHVATLERQLADAQRSYTAKHPEIQRLEAQLATARIEQAQARTQASTAGRAPQKAEQSVAQLTADRDRLRARIRELQAIEGRLPQELATYQARVNQAPIVEQQLAPARAGLRAREGQHQRLAERYQSAVISENLETRRAGSQFAVLYPASKPSTPDAAQRAAGLRLLGDRRCGPGRRARAHPRVPRQDRPRRAHAAARVRPGRAGRSAAPPPEESLIRHDPSPPHPVQGRSRRHDPPHRARARARRHRADLRSPVTLRVEPGRGPRADDRRHADAAAGAARNVAAGHRPPRVRRHARQGHGRRAAAVLAGGRAVPHPAHPHRAGRERRAAPDHPGHEPGRRRRQDGHRRQPGVDDGAGVPAPGAADRRRPAQRAAARMPRHPARAGPVRRPRRPGVARRRAGVAVRIPRHRAAGRARRTAVRPSSSARSRCAGWSRTSAAASIRVVIDSTAAHFADAGVLEPLVDGVLLIVRAGRTSRPAVGRALGLVPRAKLLGLVLNDSRASSR